MFRRFSLACLAGASFIGAGCPQAHAIDATWPLPERPVIYGDQPARQAPPPQRVVYPERPRMGGGFIEFLFNDGAPPSERYQPRSSVPSYDPRRLPPMDQQQYGQPQEEAMDSARPAFDPKYEPQMVEYSGKESAGTIVVDTPNKFLYLVQGGGQAMRYGIGVGKPGFTWAGVKTITAKKEWPAWTPPPEMLVRRPDLPRHMEGGPENPLGARAMYLGSTLYRIHGSNEPWTIGTNVSSGCIRMRNQDVIDLYGRVNVGARVVVI
jgi:lipoprotein-anchoring transpeptidase ErfK/SrfK